MSQVTKRALEASLKNLLLQKPLSKITISDITEDCGINRMTFYYHFKDIYDLVEWSCLEDARRALEEADFIAAEDTRVTLKLLNHFGITKPLVSYYQHNKERSGERIVERILSGEN